MVRPIHIVGVVVLIALRFHDLARFFYICHRGVYVQGQAATYKGICPLILGRAHSPIASTLVFRQLMFARVELIVRPTCETVFVLLCPRSRVFIMCHVAAGVMSSPFFRVTIRNTHRVHIGGATDRYRSGGCYRGSLVMSNSFRLWG